MLFTFPQPVPPPGHLRWFSPPIWGTYLRMGWIALWRCWSCSTDSSRQLTWPRCLTFKWSKSGEMSPTLRDPLMKGAREIQCCIIITIVIIHAGQGWGNYSREESYLLRVCRTGPSRKTVYILPGLEEKKHLNIALVLYFRMKEELSNRGRGRNS